MEKTDVVAALAALAQNNRLDVYRLLVQAGPDGMPAGAVADALQLARNTLTFHFDRLRPDYGKWMIDDPSVYFDISTRGREPGLDHLGIQVEDQTELHEVYARLR